MPATSSSLSFAQQQQQQQGTPLSSVLPPPPKKQLKKCGSSGDDLIVNERTSVRIVIRLPSVYDMFRCPRSNKRFGSATEWMNRITVYPWSKQDSGGGWTLKITPLNPLQLRDIVCNLILSRCHDRSIGYNYPIDFPMLREEEEARQRLERKRKRQNGGGAVGRGSNDLCEFGSWEYDDNDDDEERIQQQKAKQQQQQQADDRKKQEKKTKKRSCAAAKKPVAPVRFDVSSMFNDML